ncbi:amidophosphoribosyltransferase [Pseudaestuariivita sp.]|uniref:amidophosphoribosyltransferase n=1 Tax=Pseudaestuariivita sp. TaxID=2211669 RepID=UPI0040593643
MSQAGQLATEEVDMARRGPLLLGTTMGDAPRALVKFPSGRTRLVGKGDLVRGRRILAIEEGRIALGGNGTTRWLTQP